MVANYGIFYDRLKLHNDKLIYVIKQNPSYNVQQFSGNQKYIIFF